MSLKKARNIFGSGADVVTPNAFILSWYNALAVKPSSGLVSALNTLTAGMNTDGDWTEADFVAISAGMETEEQALRPLKTTGNSVMTNVDFNGGSTPLVWSTSGYPSNGDGGILSGYNPSTNGVKYTLNSAFLGFYGNTRVNSGPFCPVCGGDSTYDEITFNNCKLSIAIAATSVATSQSRGPNDDSILNTATKTKTSGDANVPFYAGLKRTASNSKIAFINGINSTVFASASTNVPDGEFAAVGLYSRNDIGGSAGTPIPNGRMYARATIFGSSLISQTNTGARLNTFFQSRGLNPYV